MTTIRRGYADGPFGQIHFRDTTGSGVPLVLLHQAPLSSRQFDRVYPLFAAAGVRAIGIDLPGLGDSDFLPDKRAANGDEVLPSIEDYAQVVPAVLDHLGIAATHLCGHHTGAMVCAEAAVRWPDRILSVSLSGPVPLEPEERQEFQETIIPREKAYTPKADGSHLQEIWDSRMSWMPEREDVAELCTGYLLQQLGTTAPFWYEHNAAFAHDMTPALKRLTQPTLVIANTTDMIFHLGQRTMELRPDFHYVEIEGGSIDPTDLTTVPWTDAVLHFVKQHAMAVGQ